MTHVKYSDMIDANSNNCWNVRDQYKTYNLDELREVCRQDQLPFAVCALNITGDLNVGVMLRSASLFGAEKFFILGRRKYDKRTTVGAQNYIDLERITCLKDQVTIDGDAAIDVIEDAGYAPVAVEGPNPYRTPVDVRKVDWKSWTKNKPCLIFGNEGDGIPETILKRVDHVVSIKQRGVLRSFNVSTSAGVVMYEIASQLDD